MHPYSLTFSMDTQKSAGPEGEPPGSDSPKLSLFGYTDFRAFLKEWYRLRKEKDPKFSYRKLAGLVGFKSAGHFSLILGGKANLSLRLLDRFVRILEMNQKETDYFQALVLYNQAKGFDEKKRQFERMRSFQEFRLQVIEPAQYEFFAKWHHSAVREALAIIPFRDDYAALARMIEPSITPEEASKSVALLCRLGMVVRNAQGVHRRVEPLLSSGPDAPAVTVNEFLDQSLELARNALARMSREERMLSATTLSISSQTFGIIREEIRTLRKRILNLAKKDESPDRVYQIQLHAFPLSQRFVPKGKNL